MVLGDPPVTKPEPAKAVRKPKASKPAAGQPKPEKKPTAKATGPAAPKVAKGTTGRKK